MSSVVEREKAVTSVLALLGKNYTIFEGVALVLVTAASRFGYSIEEKDLLLLGGVSYIS